MVVLFVVALEIIASRMFQIETLVVAKVLHSGSFETLLCL